MRIHRAFVVAPVALLLVMAACGDDDDDDTATDEAAQETTTTEAETTTTAEETTTTAPPAAATVALADSTLGQILVDAEGNTLYLFTPDQGGGASTCTGDCASNWPPLTVTGAPVPGDGVDAALLSTTTRDDGSTQVVYNGHPLYHFSGDTAAGQTNGQGINDVWFVVDAAGNAM
jgi:predicted lipoprotein with Yx(FWY)xxD motif